MLHPLEQVRDHQNPLAHPPALASRQAPQLCRPQFAAKEVCRHRPSPQTWYAYLITLPHLGITGSRYERAGLAGVTAGASAAERVRPGTRWVLLAVGFLWVYNGVNFLAFRVGVDALPAAFLAATRFTVAGIVLLPLAVWRVLADERPDAPSLLTAALLGIVMLVGGQALVIWGVSYLPAGEASVFGSTPPLYLALFAWFVFRQPLDRRKLLGVCVGFFRNGIAGLEFGVGRQF